MEKYDDGSKPKKKKGMSDEKKKEFAKSISGQKAARNVGEGIEQAGQNIAKVISSGITKKKKPGMLEGSSGKLEKAMAKGTIA